MDRIEECLKLRIKDKNFPIRIAEADTFLRGPRYYYDICRTKDREEVLLQIAPVPNEITCGSLVVSLPPPPVLDVDMDLVIVSIEEEAVVEGSDLYSVGPVIEGSTIEILHIHGSRQKVRRLTDVI
ncbi:hypothetical protein V6N13_126143 [Hibiscus sabdariffa]|uniref:Uncharacterized protein n=2 Tax=Hibiscus sabdariffa TaxID=183260 RepID=A0ABR2N8J1_9ROSI